MLYEIREYVAVPGRLPDLLEAFRVNEKGIFAKHGFTFVRAGRTLVGDHSFNELVCIVEWEDMAHLERSWNAVFADPEWAARLQEEEADGPLVQSMKRRFLAGLD